MPARPVIGISASLFSEITSIGTLNHFGNTDGYFDAINLAGGISLMIPLVEGATSDILNLLDGLILTGGGDIDPLEYGQQQIHNMNWGINARRDRVELDLFSEAMRRELPILGICRGAQLINVALGGTLYQDVHDQFDSTMQHQQHLEGIPKEDIGHAVQVSPGSRLAEVFGAGELHINSFHHQAIKEVGAGLEISATSADGLVEAIEYPQHHWLVGVQWHPEMMFQRHPEQLKIFVAFVQAALINKISSAQVI